MIDLEKKIKDLIIEALDLEDMTADDIETKEALFGEGLGLDSIDALELGLAIKNTFNITLEASAEDTKKHFYSVETLAKFINNQQ